MGRNECGGGRRFMCIGFGSGRHCADNVIAHKFNYDISFFAGSGICIDYAAGFVALVHSSWVLLTTFDSLIELIPRTIDRIAFNLSCANAAAKSTKPISKLMSYYCFFVRFDSIRNHYNNTNEYLSRMNSFRAWHLPITPPARVHLARTSVVIAVLARHLDGSVA